ncbi:MAG: RHS repeat-associated core domain-containing protein, partial [Bacteroidales bacterium]
YVNPYLVLQQGGQYTKHIYIGRQRLVSKLGDLGSFGVDPRREEYAGSEVSGTEMPDYASKYKALQEVLNVNYTHFEVDYYAKDNDDYVAGAGFCCSDTNPQLKSIPVGGDTYEKLQYYYHPDHLGSASYITNLDGEVVQHIEYVPFGEVFLEERNNTWNTPYLFNGKEYDSETELYYYGARYYNPRVSVWYGVDPLAEERTGLSPYQYCQNNPIMLTDPTGMLDDEWEIDKKSNARFTNDGKDDVTVNGVPISKFDFTNNEKAYSQIGNHYAHFNIGGLEDLQNFSMSVVNLDDKRGSIKVQGGYNLSDSYNYANSDIEARMFTLQSNNATINMVLNKGYTPEYYNNKYNLISDIVHERTHVLQTKNHGAWGELIAIQKQMLHYSWTKTTPAFRVAVGNYANANIDFTIGNRKNRQRPTALNRIQQMYFFMQSAGLKGFQKDLDWEYIRNF